MNFEQMNLACSILHILVCLLSFVGTFCSNALLPQSISWHFYLFQNQSLEKLLKLAICSWCSLVPPAAFIGFVFPLGNKAFLLFLTPQPSLTGSQTPSTFFDITIVKPCSRRG